MEFGGGHTGWSCAWLINLYARLQNGDKAADYLKYLLTKLTAPNMFDLHPPLDRIMGIPWVFQIDGNFGGTCGIAQLFLQSHLDEIFILPALPGQWKSGKITGLRAEGGFCLDMEWENGELKEAFMISECGETAVLRCRQMICVEKNGVPVNTVRDDKGRFVFETERNGKYRIIPQ